MVHRVSGWGSDKLASPGDFLNAYKVTMGGAKAHPEPDVVMVSQGSRQDTIKPTPVDVGKANKGSVKMSQGMYSVLFSKSYDGCTSSTSVAYRLFSKSIGRQVALKLFTALDKAFFLLFSMH